MFSACGSNLFKPKIIGVWKVEPKDEIDKKLMTIRYTFREDGTGEESVIYKVETSELDDAQNVREFEWTTDDTEVYNVSIFFNGEYAMFKGNLKDDKLLLYYAHPEPTDYTDQDGIINPDPLVLIRE